MFIVVASGLLQQPARHKNEFENFDAVVSLPDFYRCCYEPLYEEYSLFEYITNANNMHL